MTGHELMCIQVKDNEYAIGRVHTFDMAERVSQVRYRLGRLGPVSGLAAYGL